MITSRIELAREEAGAEWRVENITRSKAQWLKHLSTSGDGQTYGIVQDEQGEWLARLDPDTGEWSQRQPTPELFPAWLAEDQTSVRYFWSNGKYQVISKWGDTVLPRVLLPFAKDRIELDTDAHFFTRDGGRNWHQLAIPGYLGVMGLSSHGSQLFWTKGNWYTNDEPLVWQYDLTRD